jgi:hypothetical protein
MNRLAHVFSFLLNEEIESYIGLHGVTPDEFEEVVLNSYDLKRSGSSGRPMAFGPTSSGKFLACVFEFLDSKTVIPVTAYEVDDEA